MRTSLTVGTPASRHADEPVLTNCSAANSYPGAAEPRITLIISEVHVERGDGVAGADRGVLDGAVVDAGLLGAIDVVGGVDVWVGRGPVVDGALVVAAVPVLTALVG